MAGDVVVGTMVVALTARTAQLEKDLAKAKAQIAEFGESSKRQSEQAAHATDAHTLSHGQLERAIRHTAAGVALMSGAFREAGEVGQIAAHALGAFMTGSPLAGGISLATGLFGLLAKGTDAAGEAARKADDEYKKLLDSIRKQGETAARELDRLQTRLRALDLKKLGIDVPEGVFEHNRIAASLDEDIARFNERIGAMVRLRENAERIKRTGVTGLTNDAESELMGDAGVSRGRMTGDDWIEFLDAEIDRIKRLNAERALAAARERAIAAATQEVASVEKSIADNRARASSGSGSGGGRGGDGGLADERERLAIWLEAGREQDRLDKAHDAALKAWIDDMDRIDAAQRRIDDSVQSMLDGFANVKAEAEALTDEQMEIVRAQEAFNRALALGADIIQAEAVYDAALAAEHAKNVRKWIDESDRAFERGQKEAEKVGKALANGVAKGAAEAKAEIDPLFASMTQTLESGLADAIVDGFTDGGRNAADIFRNLIRSLEREVVGSLVHSALGGLAGLFGGGGGIASLFGGGGGMGGGAAATALAGAADCPT